MKKVLSAILTLAISVCSLAVLPVSAETAPVSNMTWNVDRGTWEQNENTLICTGTTDRQWVYSNETVAVSDDWTFSADVETVSAGQQFYFGSSGKRFGDSGNRIYVHVLPDNNLRVYAQLPKDKGDGTTEYANTQYGGTRKFPEGSSALKYNIKIVKNGNVIDIEIDDKNVFTFDITLPDKDNKFEDFSYTGGHFAIFQPNDNITTYSNMRLEIKPRLVGGRGATVNPDGSITTSGAEKAWSRMSVANFDTSKAFEMSYDIVHTAGNYQWEFHFGVSSDDVDAIKDGYFLSINYSDNNIADDIIINTTVLNEDGTTSAKRVSARFAFPETSDMDNFNVTVKYLNGYVRIYIDGELLCTSAEKLEMPGRNAYLRVRQCESTISLKCAGSAETLTGDVNMDNRFDSADLVQLRKYMLGAAKIIDDTAADCNNDGVLDIKDLIRAKKLTADII